MRPCRRQILARYTLYAFGNPRSLYHTGKWRIRSVIILGDLTYQSNTCPLMLSPPVFNPCMRFLSFPRRFISRTKRFRPSGYACLSVELLQSPAADCIVRCSGPYSLLQWTVQSIAADCNNLPFKRPWPAIGNGLFFPLFVIWYLNPQE